MRTTPPGNGIANWRTGRSGALLVGASAVVLLASTAQAAFAAPTATIDESVVRPGSTIHATVTDCAKGKPKLVAPFVRADGQRWTKTGDSWAGTVQVKDWPIGADGKDTSVTVKCGGESTGEMPIRWEPVAGGEGSEPDVPAETSEPAQPPESTTPAKPTDPADPTDPPADRPTDPAPTETDAPKAPEPDPTQPSSPAEPTDSPAPTPSTPGPSSPAPTTTPSSPVPSSPTPSSPAPSSPAPSSPVPSSPAPSSPTPTVTATPPKPTPTKPRPVERPKVTINPTSFDAGDTLSITVSPCTTASPKVTSSLFSGVAWRHYGSTHVAAAKVKSQLRDGYYTIRVTCGDFAKSFKVRYGAIGSGAPIENANGQTTKIPFGAPETGGGSMAESVR